MASLLVLRVMVRHMATAVVGDRDAILCFLAVRILPPRLRPTDFAERFYLVPGLNYLRPSDAGLVV